MATRRPGSGKGSGGARRQRQVQRTKAATAREKQPGGPRLLDRLVAPAPEQEVTDLFDALHWNAAAREKFLGRHRAKKPEELVELLKNKVEKRAALAARSADIVRRRRRERGGLPDHLTSMVIRETAARLGLIATGDEWQRERLRAAIDRWLTSAQRTLTKSGATALRRGPRVEHPRLERAVFRPGNGSRLELNAAIETLAIAKTEEQERRAKVLVEQLDVEEGLYTRLQILFKALRNEGPVEDSAILLRKIHALVVATLPTFIQVTLDDSKRPKRKRDLLAQLSEDWLRGVTPVGRRAPHEWAKLTAAAVCGEIGKDEGQQIEWADKKVKEYAIL
jgi:hypothetical protein